MRLIDADALTELIATNVYPLCDAFNSRDYGMFWTGGIEKAINEMPTIDAVEVVRCKDCKYRYMSDLKVWECTFGLMIIPNGFCNYGEEAEK